MRFNPTEAWESVNILSGGETTHNENITIIRIQLPNENSATTDKENVLVLRLNFIKYFALIAHSTGLNKME